MQMWKSLVTVFVPGRGLTFIEEFFETLKQCSNKDRATLQRLRLLYVLLVAQCLGAFVVLVTPRKTRYYQLITFNFLVWHGFPVATNLEAFVFTLFYMNYVYIIFTRSYHNYSVQIMYKLFVKKDKSFVFNSKEQIEETILRFFNIFQLMSIALDGFIIFNYIKFILIFVAEYGLFANIHSMLGLISFHISFTLYNSCLAMSLYFGGLGDTMGMATWLVFRIRVRHLQKILGYRVTKFTVLRLQYFQQEQHKTFKFLYEVNKLFSIIFTTFLLSSSPLSATLLTALLTQSFSLFLTLGLTTFVSGVFIAILFLHYTAAKFSKHLHSPYHRVMSLNIRLLRCSLRARLRLAWNIQAFHVHKRYGLMYAYCGLITMLAFAKVICKFGNI